MGNLSDREERRLIRSMLRPGMNALDIGANIGMYSLFLGSLVGSNGRALPLNQDRKTSNGWPKR